MPRTPAAPYLIGNRVATARTTTERVQEDLQLAEAELQLSNAVIADKLGDSVPDPDLEKAVIHNEQVQEKLHEAAEDLKLVTDLLGSEEREREKLEQALAEYRHPDGAPVAGARSGVGSESVIGHLRQLIRHRLGSDQALPGEGDPPAASGGKDHSPSSS